MEKSNYTRPVMGFERFVPNHYCEACIAGIDLQCAIPGQSVHYVDDGNQGVTINNRYHSICKNKVRVEINLGTGMEISDNPNIPPHAIYAFQLGEIANNGENTYIDGYNSIGTADYSTGWHKAHWKSDDEGNRVYEHYGLVNVIEIDPNHPNHS